MSRQAEAWAAEQAAAVSGVTIRYRRGSQAADIAAAIVGRTTFRVTAAEGFAEREQTRDYIVPPEAIDFGDGPVTPRPGDRIEEPAADGQTYVYEVTAINGEPAWRWWGHHRTRRRIHTRHVATQ